MLNAKVDPNEIDAVGRRPLPMAIDNNSLEIVKLLLAAGAKPALTDKNGESPLYKAVYWENATIVQLLLAAGADVNQPNAEQITPLDEAKNNGNVKISSLLENFHDSKRSKQIETDRAKHEALKNKAKVAKEERFQKEQSEKAAAEKEQMEAAAKAQAEQEKSILKKYPIKDGYALTPFIKALRDKDTDAAKLLLEKLDNINATHPELDTTPLLEAIHEENSDIIRILLKKGADTITRVAEREHSPLSLAVSKNAYKLVEVILNQNKETLPEILNNPDQIISLQFVAYKDAKMFDLLLSAGADPYFGGRDIPSPVIKAIEKASIAILPVLAKHKIDLNKQIDGQTPLEWAIHFNKIDWVTGLLSEGVETDAKNEDGKTPLEMAQEMDDREDIIQLLS